MNWDQDQKKTMNQYFDDFVISLTDQFTFISKIHYYCYEALINLVFVQICSNSK